MEPIDPDERPTPEQEAADREGAGQSTHVLPAEPRTAQQAQVRLILERLGHIAEPGPPGWERTGQIEYFVRRGFLLVPDEYVSRAREMLGRMNYLPREGEEPPPGASEFPAPGDGEVEEGVRWVRLRPGVSTFEALNLVRRGREGMDGLGDDAVDPEYFIHLAPDTGTCCPADEPIPVPLGSPPDPHLVADRAGGDGVRVVVLDTGFDPAAAALPWLRDVTGDPDPGIAGSTLDTYAGHGTFVAGVVRAVAPRAEVIVRAAFGPLGMVFERELVRALRRTLFVDHPDVINMSAGTLAQDLRAPRLLHRFYERHLSRFKGVVLVVAAGNDGDRRQFWPGGYPWTVAVGALAANWRERADFSNFGGWVDAYAPGQHLVNAYPSGTYTYQEPPRKGDKATFGGMASWSGTSFSSPVVAGLIAARMSRTGENGVDAAAALLGRARSDALPGVGAVLLPTADHLDAGPPGSGAGAWYPGR
jgi:hypothetical protein